MLIGEVAVRSCHPYSGGLVSRRPLIIRSDSFSCFDGNFGDGERP